MPSLLSRWSQPTSPASLATCTCRRVTSGRSRNRSNVMVSPGNRLMPRHFEYRLTNSAASRANLEIGCRSKKRMIFGNEALFVLHFHRVERATVGVDADQKDHAAARNDPTD